MDDEILQEFLAESWENLSRLDTEIVSLEKDPHNADLLASIFRTIHTIKGTCGFIGLTELGSVAHSGENVLGKMRDGVLEVTPDAISLVLCAIDVIKGLLQGLEATGKEPTGDNSTLIANLDALAEGGTVPTAEPVVTDAAETVATSEPAVEIPAAQPDEAAVTSAPAEAVPVTASSPDTETAPKPETSPKPSVGDAPKSSIADLSIRVNVDVLDSLMNLVGELVLTRNQLLQLARGDEESKYAAPITHLNRVTTDLQEGVMKTRMQPIGNAWKKLPRLVRDLTQVTGHQIELEMSGAETELDRTVLDAIKDPLTHMIRNSADHGIESPAERIAAGKPEAGRIRLNAYHEGGHVIISIDDDGAGVNTERVLQKAIANGLVSDAEAAKISHNEILALLFHPGLSTAESVTSVSGRGVGMDVVKTSIERIGGMVDLTSTAGKGTTVRIKIPLTLAIISALVVESGGESFAIPQLGVVELVRLAAEDKSRIERIHDNEVFRLRDRLLPLVHLNDVLGLDDPDSDEDRDVNIVVVQVGDDQLGLIVVSVFDTEEIVVKPMGSLLKDLNIYQGTTILGDGRVIMILDVAGVAAHFGGLTSGGPETEHRTESETELAGEQTSLLLFQAGDGNTMAVPLSLVARLEELPQETIECSGDRSVVQYRGDLLPLIPMQSSGTSAANKDASQPQQVIVFSEGRHSMGLMVDEIKDIHEERLVIRMQSQRPGVLGTAIIDGKATDVIDTQHYLMQANPDWFSQTEQLLQRHVLVIDDSMFFRQLVCTALETSGYRVTAINSAVEAVEVIEHGARFDAVVVDIEMPMMDGCEFAEWYRSRPEAAGVPLVALSALSPDATESRALQSGFDRYLAKFNSQQLLSSLAELFQRAEHALGASA